jgi:hypothetical protein
VPTAGDDGPSNAQHRSHREGGSALHRLLRRADIHRGTCGISDGAICRPCRLAKGRASRRLSGLVGQGCDACAIAQGSRLPHRPIRPVSPRGSQRVFAHGAGLGRNSSATSMPCELIWRPKNPDYPNRHTSGQILPYVAAQTVGAAVGGRSALRRRKRLAELRSG